MTIFRDFQGPRPRRDIDIARPRHSKTCLETDRQDRRKNSEGVDDNEPCSLIVKEAPPPKRINCNSTAKIRKWDETYLRYEFFFCRMIKF